MYLFRWINERPQTVGILLLMYLIIIKVSMCILNKQNSKK